MQLKDIVRVGIVSSVNVAKKTARVIFPDYDDMVSGDLYILQHPASITVAESGDPVHTHTASFGAWMPAVGQSVLCLYIPVENGDGFILGVI